MATIFWERLLALCDEKNSTPTEQLKAAGLAAGNVTYWKNGRIPNTKIIENAPSAGKTRRGRAREGTHDSEKGHILTNTLHIL